MVALSLDQLVAASGPNSFSEDDIEDLYTSLDDLGDDTSDKLQKDSAWKLFCLAQHVMRAKNEQLSVAVEELDNLAEVAGENEELKRRNRDLEKLVSKTKSKVTGDGPDVDLRVELEELQTTRNQLKKDLKQKQRQLDDEKRENEKLTSRYEATESERRELRRQLDQLSENLDEMRHGYELRSEPDDTGERQYAELIRQKNQYINVLLDDVEAHDRENAALRTQAASLGDQLAAATAQIETMTAEFEEIRRQWRPPPSAPPPPAADASAADAEAEADARRRLEQQVAELQTAKSRRDRQFDQLSVIVEQRTDEFKKLIAGRDAEIEVLQLQVQDSLTKAGADGAGDRARLRDLQALCDDQRRQLARQRTELQRATAEMQATAAQLESSRAATVSGDDPARVSLLGVQAELVRAQARVRELSSQLEHTERQAAEYNDQVTELTARLREVMEGEFGLAEAVADIKERQRQLAVRDRQVAEQNQYINLVQRHLTELADENTALRSRLGLEPHEAALLVESQAGREKLVHVLEREVEKLEEERIALKLENRKLSRQLRDGGGAGLAPDEIRDICRQRREFWDYVKRLGPAAVPAERARMPDADVFERLANQETELSSVRSRLSQSELATAQALAENENLRQGMREILQSIKEQDAVSAVKLAAPSLEALLQALDTRGLVGDFHAQLVPYSQLQQLEGKNDELRDQLRHARLELRTRSVGPPPAARGGSAAADATSCPQLVQTLLAAGQLQLPTQVTSCSGQLIGQLTSQLVVALKALDEQRSDSETTRSELESLRQKFALVRHQTALLYKQLAEDTDRWQAERRQLVAQAEESSAKNEELRAQLTALETGALALRAPADQQRTAVCEAHRQAAVRVSELLRCERRLRLVTADRDEAARRLRRAETEAQRAQMATTARVAALNADKSRLQFQLTVLQRELEASAPLSSVSELADKVDRLSALYTTLVADQQRLLGEERTSRLLEAELENLRGQLAAVQDSDLAPSQHAEAASSLKTAEAKQHEPTGSEETELDDMTTVRARLLEATARETRQRQRADHAHKMSQMLRDQLRSAEARCEQLESRAAQLAEAGAAGRLALAKLADQLTAADAPAEDVKQLQQKLVSAESERDRLAATLEVATGQLQHLRRQHQADDAATHALQQLWMDAQQCDDPRAAIASLHQRLLSSERSAAELELELSTTRTALQTAEARIYRAETAAADARTRMCGLRTSHTKQIRLVRCVVQQLRGCLSLPQRTLQERLSQSLTELLTQRRQLVQTLTRAKAAAAAAEGERDGVRAQGALLERALQQLPSGGGELKHWLQRCSDAELEVTALRLRCERLSADCEHAQRQLMAEQRCAADAEADICRLRSELECRRLDRELLSSPAVSPRSLGGDSPRADAPDRAASPAPAPAPADGGRAAGDGQRAVRKSQLPVPSGRPAAADTASADAEARSRFAALLRLLVTSHLVAPSSGATTAAGDVSGLESRVAGADTAAQLIAVGCDVIQRVCDVTGDADAASRTVEAEPPRPPPRRGTWTEESLSASMAGVAAAEAPAPAAWDLWRQRRLLVAETAAATLRERLRQKEAALAEYARLLQRARQQAVRQADQQEEERARDTEQLRQQLTLVASIETQRSALDGQPPDSCSGEQLLSSSQLSRLHESSELLAEQERAIGALMERLRQSREHETRLTDRLQSIETQRSALDGQPSGSCSGEQLLSSSQLSRLHESSELLAEQERAIGALMERLRQSREHQTRLTDRLQRLERERRDTAEVLGRTVSTIAAKRCQLRDQLLQERQLAAADAERRQLAQQRAQQALVGRLREILLKKEKQHHALARVLRDIKADVLRTVEEAAAQQQAAEAAEKPVGGDAPPPPEGDSARTAASQLAARPDSAPLQLAAAERELDAVKNDLNEKTLQCHRLQADLHEAERRRREDTQRLQRHLEQARARLRAAEQPPAAAATAAPAKPPPDPQKIQQELAKWEERKRWQRGAERLRARLRDKEAEAERQQAQTAALRDTVRRLERERSACEAKIRTLTGMVAEERYRHLERENETLKQEVAQLRGADGEGRAATVERLRQQVATLTTRLAEQRTAARRGQGAATNAAKFESELTQLRSANSQLELENAELKRQLAELRRAAAEPPEAPDPGSTAPAPDPGTVSILRRLVERLRAENLRLRRQLLRHTVTGATEQQVELLKQELHRAVADRDLLAARLQREQREHADARAH